MKVSSRARSREDHAGDPLDGLVNLFDLGIVLAVAFLLAALSSANLTSDVLSGNAQKAPAGSVVKNQDEEVKGIDLKPGQEVVGQGKAVGTVYQLADGRTVIVRKATATTPATTTPVVPPAATTPAP